MPVDIAPNLSAQRFDGSTQTTSPMGHQFNLLVAFQISDGINLLPSQLGRIVETTRIAGVARRLGSNPKPYAIAIVPFPPHMSDAHQKVSRNLLGPRGMPNSLALQEPTASVWQFLRFTRQHPFQVYTCILLAK